MELFSIQAPSLGRDWKLFQDESGRGLDTSTEKLCLFLPSFAFPLWGWETRSFFFKLFFFTVHFGRPHFFLTKKITGIFWAITQLGSFVTGCAAAWLMELAFSWLPSPFRALVYCPIPKKKKKKKSHKLQIFIFKKMLCEILKGNKSLDIPFPGLQTPRPLPLFLFKHTRSWLMTCESSSPTPTSLLSSAHMPSRSCVYVGGGSGCGGREQDGNHIFGA